MVGILQYIVHNPPFLTVVFQEREKREREQAKIQAVEDEKKAAKDEEERLRAIAKAAKAEREAHKKEMRRRKKVRACVRV